MNVVKYTHLLLSSVLMAASGAALACGEMMVNSGKGLAFQSYLDSNPAEVLVLFTEDSDERAFAGLEQAGHHLKLVVNASQLAEELASGKYDIVIAEYALVDTVAPLASSTSGTRLLPIVARGLRRSTDVKERFKHVLEAGRGVSSYQAVIRRVMSQ